MGNLSRKLRIGEKIGFGFGVVGLLFLGVIWQYHNTLQQALTDYRQLHDVYGAGKDRAMVIENSMLRAQHAEKNFVLTRDQDFADEVLENLERALGAAAGMRAGDGEVTPVAEQMILLIDAYGQRFRDLVEAWRTKGLDHDSGLQGAFRDSAHELEDMAGKLKVDRLYLLLLQIRRGEKDLGLRREEQYRERVLQLIQDFSQEVADSGLDDGLKAILFHEIAVYRDTFNQYANTVLGNSQLNPGKGPFRQAAHRIEDQLQAHYLSGMGEKILQVRRREKDYLLRDDKKYVDMAIAQLDQIAVQVQVSAIAEEDKKRFIYLVDSYRRDFLALVAQNDLIARLNEQMLASVSEIVGLVEENVESADQAMSATREHIDELTTSNERAMLWVVFLATSLGIFLAIAITLPIVRPLRRMAGVLDRLAAEEPAERVPFFPGGRDEVNAMAGSVNEMADHKAGFIAWWKAAMREADARERFQEVATDSAAELAEAEDELNQSMQERRTLLQERHHHIYQLSERIIERADSLLKQAHPRATEIALNAIRYSAKSVQATLMMVSVPDTGREGAG